MTHREIKWKERQLFGRLFNAYLNPRRERRAMRDNAMGDPVGEAYSLGQALAYGSRMPPRLQRNPYPPGRRHDAWNIGFKSADPMGDHHGRNK